MTQNNKGRQDPRGVAASRGQSGRQASQGQHSGQRRSRPDDRGSPPEGERPMTLPRKVTLAVGREPTFFIGGGNGVALVEDTLTELGWKRITDKYNEHFKIKWVECKNTINYNAFREGDQLVNHIPNCNLLTNKMGLLTSLQSYERLNSALKRRETRLKMSDFIPETYRLDEPGEREQFLQAFQYSDIWICKPTGMNQGKGIFLVRDVEDFKVTLLERDERRLQTQIPRRAYMGRIIQKYIKYPLLLEGRKFDIRAYMLIGSSSPYLVLYHKGYVRLSLLDYDVREDNLMAHLTNQYIQKKDPNYQEEKESTAWSMDKFNHYVNTRIRPGRGMERDWVYKTLTTRMKQIMLFCFHAVKNKLHCKLGYFDLYGLDFMVDEEMKVYLIEINVNPSLATNCEALRQVIPEVVRETLYITLECFEKLRRGHALMPLHSLKTFEVLHNGCPKSSRASAGTAGRLNDCSLTRSPGNSPIRRQTLSNTQGHTSQGHTSQGHTSQGHTSQGHTSHGHTSQGHTSQGHTAHGHTSQGHTAQGQSSQGHPAQGHVKVADKGHTVPESRTRVIQVGMTPESRTRVIQVGMTPESRTKVIQVGMTPESRTKVIQVGMTPESRTRVIQVGMTPTTSKPVAATQPVPSLPGLRGAVCLSAAETEKAASVSRKKRKKVLKLKMTHTNCASDSSKRIATIQEDVEGESQCQEEEEEAEEDSADDIQMTSSRDLARGGNAAVGGAVLEDLEITEDEEIEAVHGSRSRHRSETLILPKVSPSTSGVLLKAASDAISQSPVRGN